MAKIWITGCNGFIGSQLSTSLALKGHQIRLFHRSPITTTDFHPSCKFVAYNNSNLKSVMHESMIDFLPSSIFHLSGCSSVDVAESDPLSLVDLVDSTSKICDFVVKHCPSSSVILASSPSVMGNSLATDSLMKPISYYALQKSLAENIVEYYSRVYNLNSIIARIFSCYGSGLKKQVIWDSCRKLLTPNPSFRGTGRELRDFIHISDVCEVLSVFTLDKWTSGSYNVDVGTGTSISISRVVQLCADALQRKGLQPFDWHFADACDNRAPSAMKALNTAEWSPHHSSFLPIAEGIDSYVEWFVDSGSNL